MSDKYAVNTEVEWESGSGTGRGKVREVSSERVSRAIKGNEVSRNATEDDPAYLIEQHDGPGLAVPFDLTPGLTAQHVMTQGLGVAMRVLGRRGLDQSAA